MASWIDWHSHHTAPEVVEQFAAFAGKKLKGDDYDSIDFAKRVKEMDEVGLDLQLICQGAGLYADQLPADQALKIMQLSNTTLGERIAPHRDRFIGMTALSQKNIAASVEELERTSSQGFRAALLYPTVDGEMIVELP
jgi:2,3-dihydroxybenzoate decarboxylase